MSVMIKERADNLVQTFMEASKKDGKINAKA